MNVMSKRMAARRRALRAVQAVSIGGVAFASQACGSEASSSGGEEDVTNVDGAVSADAELDIPEQDIRVDVAEDVGEDAELDTGVDAATDAELDSIEPDVAADVAEDVPQDTSVEVGADTAIDTTPEDVTPDAPEDTAPDTAPDVEPDAEPDVAEDVAIDSADGGDSCEPEEDNVCPENCTQDNDWDCCQRFADESGLPCFYDPSFGCSCAAVGPFNPPTMPGRSVMASS